MTFKKWDRGPRLERTRKTGHFCPWLKIVLIMAIFPEFFAQLEEKSLLAQKFWEGTFMQLVSRKSETS